MRWKPSPLVSASAVLHAAAAAMVLARPSVWPWALGVVAANHLLLAGAGLWPRSRLLGPNWVQLPQASRARGEVAITIDDGPDPLVTPQVLDLLDRSRAQASFFCIGEKLLRHPQLAREIIARGHCIENHSEHHRHNFSLLGPAGLEREILGAQNSIAQLTGYQPLFFRAPAGLRNPFLDYVLSKLDLRLASWTRRGFDTVNSNPQDVLDKLQHNLAAGDILLVHDGNAARSVSGSPVILEVLPRLLEILHSRGLRPVTLRAALS